MLGTYKACPNLVLSANSGVYDFWHISIALGQLFAFPIALVSWFKTCLQMDDMAQLVLWQQQSWHK